MSDAVRHALRDLIVWSEADSQRFFKTAPGAYAAHDRFLGIPVPPMRRLAKVYRDLSQDALTVLITSSFNEERLLALLIMIEQCAIRQKHADVFSFFVEHRHQVNNWNLVDVSAPAIVGGFLEDKPRDILAEWAVSPSLWERRIAIVATWWFIRRNDFHWTLKLSEMLRDDPHDLMHKAVGWMLREIGKRDRQSLLSFLEQNAPFMPRTMLRYAIERLPPHERQAWLQKPSLRLKRP